MSSNTSKPCTVCDKTKTQLCDGCKSVSYCSKACQKTDWRIHKLLCGNFSAFDVSSRPTDDHVRAIFFPADETKPRCVWLLGEWREDDEDEVGGGRWQYTKTDPFLGSDTMRKSILVQNNPISNKELSDTIQINHRDTFLVDGSKPNNSIGSITITKAGFYHDWRGPLICHGEKGLDFRGLVRCRDLDMNDFRHIADYFLWYGHKPFPADYPSTGKKIEGVRINCQGDQKLSKRSHYEAVQVSSKDAIFSDHDKSDIAKRIGLPIFTRKCPPDQSWASKKDKELPGGQYPLTNQDATFLHLCLNPNAKADILAGATGWGWAPMRWQSEVGSVIVVRQDKKPLAPLHVEALCNYCRYEMRPYIAHTTGDYYPEKAMSKEAALAMISRPSFVVYWYKFKDEKRSKGESTDAPYPYDDVDFG